MRTTLLLSALLLAVPAAAASTPDDAPLLLAQTSKTNTNTKPDDDDEEEAPAKAAPKAAAPGPAAAAPLGAVSTSSGSGEAQKLVSGAPLYNPNVAVHIVEQKEYADRGRIEIDLFPGVAQVNGKFTQHVGAGASAVWHLQENFGLTVMGLYNYVSTESAFNGELIDKVRAEAQAATSLLLVGGAVAGVEATPFYGKFAFYENNLVHFSVVLNGGAGAGFTRHQLKPSSDCDRPGAPPTCDPNPTYGNTGWRFMAEIGGGFRVQLAKWFTVRLEIRDILYTARVDTVDGCNNSDLKAMDTALRGGQPVTSANVSAGCNVNRFTGVEDYGDSDPKNDRKHSDDVPLAYSLVKTPSSDVLNNLGVYLGFGFNF